MYQERSTARVNVAVILALSSVTFVTFRLRIDHQLRIPLSRASPADAGRHLLAPRSGPKSQHDGPSERAAAPSMGAGEEMSPVQPQRANAATSAKAGRTQV